MGLKLGDGGDGRGRHGCGGEGYDVGTGAYGNFWKSSKIVGAPDMVLNSGKSRF